MIVRRRDTRRHDHKEEGAYHNLYEDIMFSVIETTQVENTVLDISKSSKQRNVNIC